MKLTAIRLENFRNYTDFRAEFAPGLNLICGENAQGKTNLLEAIEFLAGARSHRTRFDRELIRFDCPKGRIEADAEGRGREFHIEIELSRNARRRIFLNHIKLKTAGELSDALQTVLFCPEDLALIKAGASERRNFLDRAICQLRPRYAEALAQYNRLMDHKSKILRDWGKRPDMLSVLDAFNEGMARAGALVVHYRAHFLRKLAQEAEEIQREFSGGRETLHLQYATVSTIEDPLQPTTQLYEWISAHQESHRQAELDSRSCLTGPHRDDFIAEINGLQARQYASQGQARTAALSLKMAERALFRQDTGQWPILLLDDVLSELDSRRRDFILQKIRGGQVFVTGCEIPQDYAEDGKLFRIQNGTLLP